MQNSVNSKNKKVGRPKKDQDKRSRLIKAANKLFVQSDYDKVSIRAIAAEAEVDSALIRYYFQSKIGLFTAMMQEMIDPISTQLKNINQSVSNNSPAELLSTYYRIMSNNPDFPKMIFKIASMPQTTQHNELKEILSDLIHPKNIKLFSKMNQEGMLKEGVDPTCMLVSFFSLMIFPFLMPNFFKQALQIEITPDFMTQLAQQNSQLLHQGIINSQENKEDL